MESEQQSAKREKGSMFVTLLIILLFLAAGGFYLKTARPEWLDSVAVQEKLTAWKDEVAAVFKSKEDDVKETVDEALDEHDEKA